MSRVFVDTSFFISIIDSTDEAHDIAHSVYNSLVRPILHTSEEVLTGLFAYFSRSLNLRSRLLSLCDFIREHYTVHPQTSAGFEQALEFLRKRPDKKYSLVDCRSMVLMKELGIADILSSDNHFAQEGLNKLY